MYNNSNILIAKENWNTTLIDYLVLYEYIKFGAKFLSGVLNHLVQRSLCYCDVNSLNRYSHVFPI